MARYNAALVDDVEDCLTMTTPNVDDDTHDLSRYQIGSHREIVGLLRQTQRRNQLIRMSGNSETASALTAILDVDDNEGIVIVDCASTATANQRLLESEPVHFETVLDNIRVLFSVHKLESCEYEGRPALYFAMPENVIRLQRREHYRVFAPVAKPVRCTIPIRDEESGTFTTAIGTLFNVSGGGLSITDEKKLIPGDIGEVFESCQIDIPGSPIVVALQLMNSQDITLANRKQVRRLGFMFVDPSNATQTAIQRYITKIEREQNARATGMA